ncbi:MAG: DUF3667 domain-containing protein, partial [Bacteroidota bacterium]
MIPFNPQDPLETFQACKNCGADVWQADEYCSECGQKVYSGPPRFTRLFIEFFGNLFNLDNRLFRTVRDLAVPARVTQNYLSGQQRIYLNPLRVFFITGVLFITICSNLLSDSLGKEITESTNEDRANAYYLQFFKETKSHVD